MVLDRELNKVLIMYGMPWYAVRWHVMHLFGRVCKIGKIQLLLRKQIKVKHKQRRCNAIHIFVALVFTQTKNNSKSNVRY